MCRGHNHFWCLGCRQKLLSASCSRENSDGISMRQTISIHRLILRRCAAPFNCLMTTGRPWLENLRELIKRYVAANENAVLACSALKRVYRKHLRVSAEV